MSTMVVIEGFKWKVCLMFGRADDIDDDKIKSKIHIIACESVHTQVRKLNNIYH